jgi:hypothetical protein
VVGLNRDLHHKQAGVRTNALVSLGAALAVIVVMPPGESDSQRIDALSRVIQGVLTGIGFLGGASAASRPRRRSGSPRCSASLAARARTSSPRSHSRSGSSRSPEADDSSVCSAAAKSRRNRMQDRIERRDCRQCAVRAISR